MRKLHKLSKFSLICYKEFLKNIVYLIDKNNKKK